MKVGGINRLIIATGMLPQMPDTFVSISVAVSVSVRAKAVDTVLQFRPPAAT